MKVEEIIEKDKVREVREDFYNGIMEKMARNKMDDAGPVIRKRHLGMSIAAGIALGILVGKYNINDTKLECIEDRLFN